MAKVTGNARSYSDGGIFVAPIGSTAPTTPTASYSVAWTELGWISDGGITESTKVSSKTVKAWQNGTTIRTLKTDWEKTVKFQCLEENAVVMGLLRPGSTISRTGGTSEVQTATITGTPTGGSFTLTFNGATTGAIAYNATGATVQTALQALSTVGTNNATVAGSAGGPYTITFAGSLASQNVAAVTVDASLLTGGSTPGVTIATTTPGVAGITTTAVKPYLGQDLREFGIDLIDGGITRRLIIPNGEVDPGGDVVSKSDELTVYEFTLTAYPDVTGVAVYEISNNPAL